jgi:hypothetical protein
MAKAKSKTDPIQSQVRAAVSMTPPLYSTFSDCRLAGVATRACAVSHCENGRSPSPVASYVFPERVSSLCRRTGTLALDTR